MKNLFLVGAILSIVACSSVVPMNSEEAVTFNKSLKEFETEVVEAKAAQVDLFSQDEFAKAETYLTKTKNAMAAGDGKGTLEEFSQAKKYLSEAKINAKGKKDIVPLLFKSRDFAVKSGVHNYKDIKKKLKDIDEDVMDETKKFTKNDLTPEEFSKIENRYLDVEVMTVQANFLTESRERIAYAKEKDASDRVPKTFRDAKINLLNAENQIARNPRNSTNFKKTVEQAEYHSILLKDVIDTVHANGKGTSENVALQLVSQQRKLGTLSGKLSSTKSDLSSTDATLAEKEKQMAKARLQVEFQKTMDQVRQEFNEEEADVYQQGERLVIRLKDIRFPNGQATIPERSQPLLNKVSTIIKNLEPSVVEVQGHTDSSGSRDMNEKLSVSRANAVAEMFIKNSVVTENDKVIHTGLGDSRPIATNKTKEGRAINRRVDIVLTKKINL